MILDKLYHLNSARSAIVYLEIRFFYSLREGVTASQIKSTNYTKDLNMISNWYIIAPAEGRDEGFNFQQSRINAQKLRSTPPIGQGDTPVLIIECTELCSLIDGTLPVATCILIRRHGHCRSYVLTSIQRTPKAYISDLYVTLGRLPLSAFRSSGAIHSDIGRRTMSRVE